MSLLLRRGILGSLAGDTAIYNETFTARNFSSSPLAIPLTLEGDTYDYQLVCFFASASGDSILDVTLNSDTTSNYRNYEMKGLSTAKTAATGDADTAIELQNLIGTANPNLLMMDITGSSGDERYIDSFYAADGAILKQSSFWKNTANELDEITLTAASSVTCDAHVILYQTPKASDQNNWELLSSHTYTAEDVGTTPQSFTGLSLDTDIEYKVVYDVVTNSGTADLWLQVNSDSGTNYTDQQLRNDAGTLTSSAISGTNRVFINDSGSGRRSVSTCFFKGDSSVKRMITVSTGQDAPYNQIEGVDWWNNTVDDLDSIDLTASSSTSITGTAKLYKLIDTAKTGDSLPFETLNTVNVSGDFSAGDSYSINVDSYKLVKIDGFFSTVGNDLRLQIDADTGSTYTDQYIKGVGSTASAAASGSIAYQLLCDASASKVARFEYYIYPKSGENRPSLLKVYHGEDSIEYKAGWWANSIDAINSFKIYASSTTTCTGTILYSILR